MSHFLVLNFKDFGLNQDITQTIQPQTLLCICCLKTNVAVINLSSCKHSWFLDSFSEPQIESTHKLICYQCHAILKKIQLFKEQVSKSFDILKKEGINTIRHENVRNLNIVQKTVVNMFLPPAKFTDEKVVSEFEMDITPVSNETVFIKEAQSASPGPFVEGSDEQPVLLVSAVKEEFVDQIEELSNSKLLVNAKKMYKAESKETNSVPPNFTTVPVEFVDSNNFTKAESLEQANDSEGDQQGIRLITLTRDDLMHERVKLASSPQYLKRPYKCNHCIIGFKYKENILDHMKRRHEPKVGSSTCEICLSVLFPAGSITAHRYRHFVRYECKACCERYMGYDECWQHCLSMHKHFAQKFCRRCGFKNKCVCTAQKRKNAERRLLKGQKQCPNCPRKFLRNDDMKMHLKIHDDLAFSNMECDYCGRTYPNSKSHSFSRHIGKHMKRTNSSSDSKNDSKCES